VSLEDGRKLTAPLIVGAEGRNSPSREQAGIRIARWRYDHTAIVSVLHHRNSHEQVAYEIFYSSGPFALLPMTDDGKRHRSAIVWSVRKDDAAGLLSLSDEDFAAEA
jgi:2-octaprenyl-6-methoxyphenol hydroxylase